MCFILDGIMSFPLTISESVLKRIKFNLKSYKPIQKYQKHPLTNLERVHYVFEAYF